MGLRICVMDDMHINRREKHREYILFILKVLDTKDEIYSLFTFLSQVSTFQPHTQQISQMFA